MAGITPLRALPQNTLFRQDDVLVLFGELFGRGYANGLVEEAQRAGMTVIGITVGRRGDNNLLRALTEEELAEAEANLGGRIINVPLMAGFDLDAPAGEATPTELVAAMSLQTWAQQSLDSQHLDRCRAVGQQRFQRALQTVMAELDGLIADGRRVLFAHTMAGGIIKTKVFLAIANRIYKGRGERFISSRSLRDSDLGRLLLQNFDEVTANTFQHLIDASTAIRTRLENSGGAVRYTAYGYHGTEILIDGRYQWQTYTNYTQGYAKMRLENIARAAWQRGIVASVFNCPEIRTNSSDIFTGVELSLFPLLQALRHEGGGPWAEQQWAACQDLLQDGVTVQDILERINAYNQQPTLAAFRNFDAWPMDNTAELAEIMISTAEDITKLHRSAKALITDHLSALVLEGAGPLMFREASHPAGPVLWLNHDIIARQLLALPH